ncbi:hypothetical protein [Kitasatospora sp. NBC_01302]|uniref:hypothetical protein n=1 Tax=Kitasatospora sp. NBC_01302 TaxID=2903575 RepID=UPI002E164F97|nr:hypothetical protein OG294_08620 [Kitasatospora sp. NBC_01302]
MSTNRSRRIDRDAAEHLLGGAADASPDGPGALFGLLAAAAAPATADELAGEEAAVAAFREAARLTSHPSASQLSTSRSSASLPSTSRRRPMAACVPQGFRVPTRFLGAKAVVAAFAVTAIGGVAVAAGTGHLPAALGGSGHSAPVDSVAATGSASPAPAGRRGGQEQSARPGSGPGSAGSTSVGPTSSGPVAERPLPGGSAGTPGAASAGPSGGASASPGAPGGASAGQGDGAASTRPGSSAPPGRAVPGAPGGSGLSALLQPLCRLWPGDGQPGTGDSRFEPLTRAAGGSNRVRAYCAALPGSGQGGGQAPTPGQVQPGGRDTPGASPVPVPLPGAPTPARTPDGGDNRGPVPPGQDSGGGNGHRRQ